MTPAGNGESLDAYVVGPTRAIPKFSGFVQAVIVRRNDVENKLIVASPGRSYSTAQLSDLVHFQEQYFDSWLIRGQDLHAVRTQVLGLKAGVVDVVPYAPYWPLLHAQESELIRRKLGGLVRRIHHIGSTAVPGLTAKPIIDMLIELHDFRYLPMIVDRMSSLDYRHRGENGIPGRQYFTKGQPRAFHVHMFPSGHARVRSHVAFRNALRNDPVLLQSYATLKQDLAQRYKDDRGGYTDAKDNFIRAVLQRHI